jgi:hypothetical protein
MQPQTAESGIEKIAPRINTALSRYSDKDWNYSRIRLHKRKLQDLAGPYVLWVDLVDARTKKGRAELKASAEEVAWGGHHSHELGILEIISLRLNKALFECTSDEVWDFRRPVIRVVKKQDLEEQGVSAAFWYDVDEILGEEFDNR